MSDSYFDVLEELRGLTMKKRAGYSPGNDPFANFRKSEMFGVSPLKGILVRVTDKLSRIASLLDNPSNDKVGESLRDTMLDAGNYLLIAVAMMDYDGGPDISGIGLEAPEDESCCLPNCRFCSSACPDCEEDCSCAG